MPSGRVEAGFRITLEVGQAAQTVFAHGRAPAVGMRQRTGQRDGAGQVQVALGTDRSQTGRQVGGRQARSRRVGALVVGGAVGGHGSASAPDRAAVSGPA